MLNYTKKPLMFLAFLCLITIPAIPSYANNNTPSCMDVILGIAKATSGTCVKSNGQVIPYKANVNTTSARELQKKRQQQQQAAPDVVENRDMSQAEAERAAAKSRPAYKTSSRSQYNPRTREPHRKLYPDPVLAKTLKENKAMVWITVGVGSAITKDVDGAKGVVRGVYNRINGGSAPYILDGPEHFIERMIKPWTDIGIKHIHLQLPHGGSGWQVEMGQYLTYKKRAPDHPWADLDKWVAAWKPVTDSGVEVIAYIGIPYLDPHLTNNRRYDDKSMINKDGTIKPEHEKEAWDYVKASIEPYVKAGMTIGFDAASSQDANSFTYAVTQYFEDNDIEWITEAATGTHGGDIHWRGRRALTMDGTMARWDTTIGDHYGLNRRHSDGRPWITPLEMTPEQIIMLAGEAGYVRKAEDSWEVRPPAGYTSTVKKPEWLNRTNYSNSWHLGVGRYWANRGYRANFHGNGVTGRHDNPTHVEDHLNIMRFMYQDLMPDGPNMNKVKGRVKCPEATVTDTYEIPDVQPSRCVTDDGRLYEVVNGKRRLIKDLW